MVDQKEEFQQKQNRAPLQISNKEPSDLDLFDQEVRKDNLLASILLKLSRKEEFCNLKLQKKKVATEALITNYIIDKLLQSKNEVLQETADIISTTEAKVLTEELFDSVSSPTPIRILETIGSSSTKTI